MQSTSEPSIASGGDKKIPVFQQRRNDFFRFQAKNFSLPHPPKNAAPLNPYLQMSPALGTALEGVKPPSLALSLSKSGVGSNCVAVPHATHGTRPQSAVTHRATHTSQAAADKASHRPRSARTTSTSASSSTSTSVSLASSTQFVSPASPHMSTRTPAVASLPADSDEEVMDLTDDERRRGRAPSFTLPSSALPLRAAQAWGPAPAVPPAPPPCTLR
eukprot:TRINITY_DN9324_c0_g2_i1.p1 TRINITY_DN9324_c0_g2~~TRINITY_DN9324_c0_g2_i1.p1  ORF type:complete len:217 (-),score=40.41 TRINITY_DN9324_c0_g2_i1:5-655(-)